jgi:hypothetical protein
MIEKYRFLKKNTFESTQKFQIRLNEECAKGWRPISMSSDNGTFIVLLERETKF